MKNNLLKEINNIKRLINLNEQFDNLECEKKLEDAGYIVYNHVEQKAQNAECGEKNIIKCVIKWFDENDIEYTSPNKHHGFCYVVAQKSTNIITPKKLDGSTDPKQKKAPKKTWTFWDNGDVTYIRTLDYLVSGGTADNKIDYWQAQFKGRFICDDDELTFDNLRFLGLYENGKTSRLITKSSEFKLYVDTSSETKKVVLAGDFFTTTGPFAKNDF